MATKTKLKHIHFGTLLLALAALVNLARWVGVYTSSKHTPFWISQLLPVLDAVSGLFTGLVIAGGLAFVAHRLGGLQPFTAKGKPIMRFWGAAVGILTILIMSAFILPPYVRMTLPDDLRTEIGNPQAWSVMAVLVGDLIIVAIALADVKAAGFTRSGNERVTNESLSDGKNRSAKRSKKSAVVHCRYEGAGCKRTGSQNAMNAHARSCEFKPTISMPVEEKAGKNI